MTAARVTRDRVLAAGLTWPQYLLLTASLRDNEAALQAWQQWRSSVDLQTVDRGSTRLLPLLWHNLVAMGVEDPLMPRLRGIYRHTWFSNQTRLAKLVEVRDLMAAASVDVIALKGVALAYGFYPNPGVRPMDDLDILVRPSQTATAVEVLKRHAWSAPVADPVTHLIVVNGTEFLDPSGDRLDLHAHLLPVGLRSDRDALRWQRAVTASAEGQSFQILDATDQLLQVCIHGALSIPPAIRWVADALAILEHGGTVIDWPRLVADAEEEGYGPTLENRLRVLVALFDVPIPEQVLSGMAAIKRPLAARVSFRLSTGPQYFLVGGLLQRRAEFGRWKRGPGRGNTTFRRYLQLVWDLGDSREMPRNVVSKAAKRVRSDLRRQPLSTESTARDA